MYNVCKQLVYVQFMIDKYYVQEELDNVQVLDLQCELQEAKK